MEQNYDFNKIGKQMPYTVPDGFFDELEENVMKEVKAQPKKKKATVIRMAFRTAIAIAACLALFLVIRNGLSQNSTVTADDFDNVELAFNNLSVEDQHYLLEVYMDQEELLIDEEEDDN